MRPFTALSLGAGQGSTALAIAIIQGLTREVRPGKVYDFSEITLDKITFADTGDEIASTYEHVEKFEAWLKSKGVTLEVVRKEGISLSDSIRERIEGRRKSASAIPAFLAPTGKAAQHCTRDWKSRPLDRSVKRAAGKGRTVEVLIGFTIEEWMRIPAKMPKEWPALWTRRYPLIEAGANRGWCVDVCLEHLGYVPQSSACAHCPHRPDVGPGSRTWIRDNEPETWKKVVAFDALIRDGSSWGLRQPAFLSKTLLPAELALEAANRQGMIEFGADGCDSGRCFT